MRRTHRVSASLAGTVCLIGIAAAPALAADAEVSPQRVAPGGTITVLVSCDPYDGDIPAGITANSQAFGSGSVELARVTGQEDNDAVVGPAYNGKARIAPATSFTDDGVGAVGRISEWSVDGECPDGEQWSAAFTVDRDGPSGSVRGGGGGSTGGTNTAALVGGVGLLVVTVGGAVCWKRRQL